MAGGCRMGVSTLRWAVWKFRTVRNLWTNELQEAHCSQGETTGRRQRCRRQAREFVGPQRRRATNPAAAAAGHPEAVTTSAAEA
jgi:hypothetical protein